MIFLDEDKERWFMCDLRYENSHGDQVARLEKAHRCRNPLLQLMSPAK